MTLKQLMVRLAIAAFIVTMFLAALLIWGLPKALAEEYNFNNYQMDSFNNYLNSGRNYTEWIHRQRVLDTQWNLQQQINRLPDTTAPAPPTGFIIVPPSTYELPTYELP